MMRCLDAKLEDRPTLKAETEMLLLTGVTAYNGKAGSSEVSPGFAMGSRGRSK